MNVTFIFDALGFLCRPYEEVDGKVLHTFCRAPASDKSTKLPGYIYLLILSEAKNMSHQFRIRFPFCVYFAWCVKARDVRVQCVVEAMNERRCLQMLFILVPTRNTMDVWTLFSE